MRGLDVGAWLLLATLALGCGRIGFEPREANVRAADAAPPVDATVPDAAQVMDAAVVPDAAPVADAATVPDAGTVPDAATAPDAAPVADAAAVLDAGTVPDAATVADAGTDAGVDASVDAGPPPPGDFCEDIPPLAADPSIDGTLEPGLVLREPPRLGWTGPSPIPAEHRAAYAFAYRPTGLYFFVAVVDSTPVVPEPSEPAYWGDGVELYVDGDGVFAIAGEYDAPGTMQFIVTAPPDGQAMAMQAERWNNAPAAFGPWASTRFGSFRTVDGYIVEAFISAADLELGAWTLASGQDVAVALSINIAEQYDEDDAGTGAGHRLGQYFNRLAAAPRGGCGTAPFCTAEAFCVTTLQ